MEKIVCLDQKNIDKFYKNIVWYKILSLLKIRITLNFCGEKFDSREKNVSGELLPVVNCIEILNTRNKYDKYSLIYDYSCDFLDNEFKSKNLCGFKNDMCICNRNKTEDKRLSSCCESRKTGTICECFDVKNKKCKIKSLGCKLFTCPYLHKKNIRYPMRKIPYLKYFLSIRQKLIAKTSTFQDKDVIVHKFIKFYKMP